MYFYKKYEVFSIMSYRTTLTERIFRNYKIDLQWSGLSDVDKRWKRINQSAPFSRLYYVQSGCGIANVNGVEHEMKPGYMYLIPSGMHYSYYCKDHFRHLFFHLTMDTVIDYDFLSRAKFTEQYISQDEINRIINLYKSESFLDHLELKTIIYKSILSLLSLQTVPITFDVNLSKDVIATIEYVKKNLSVQLTAKQICENLYVSPNTLLKKFRNEVGTPLGHYIDKLIFFEATNKLTNTSLTIKEISDELGFCDQFYFSQRFKHVVGETPTTYRKLAK